MQLNKSSVVPNHFLLDTKGKGGRGGLGLTVLSNNRIRASIHPANSQGIRSDLVGIYNAIVEARKEKQKLTIIRLRTTIGFGSKLQGSHSVHGSRQSYWITRIVSY